MQFHIQSDIRDHQMVLLLPILLFLPLRHHFCPHGQVDLFPTFVRVRRQIVEKNVL